MANKLILVNPSDRLWTTKRFVLWFGACAPTYMMVWANGIDSALDECVDWIADHAQGLLADDAVRDEYNRLVAEGLSEEKAIEEAEADTMSAGNNGHYLASDEWGIQFDDDAARPTVKEFVARCEVKVA